MLIEACGWLGAALILGSYLWVTYNKPTRGYHLVNLAACVLLIVNVYHHHAIPSIVINVVWACIAVVGLRKEHIIGRIMPLIEPEMSISEWMSDPDRGIPMKGDRVAYKGLLTLAQDPTLHPMLRRAYPFHDDV